ncbi:MAG: hypothetical protein H8E85_03450 [Candidatus Marinimicrobia bacterium]|nr:hypothetical protein [Candidatus Neomarinimicrobiota bacterium]
MIISYLCIAISIVLLALTGLQGYFQFQLIQANHPQFALFSAIFYMFTETLIMFYFIGSGTAIKKTIKLGSADPTLYEKVKKTKMILFPHLTMNMIFVGIVFILGGAVQTGSVSGWIHGLLFDLAFIHFLYVTILQHRGFKENVEIIGEIAIVEETAANNSPA